MRHLDAFVDGFILGFWYPIETIIRVSGYLDQLGKRIADWLWAYGSRRAA